MIRRKIGVFRKRCKWLVLSILCNILPMRKEIVLESNPDLSCNTYPLFRMMIDNKLNDEFKITWLVDDSSVYSEYNTKNVFFLDIHPDSFWDRIKLYVRCNRAAVSITCNRYISKYCVSKKQLNIYICHGSPIKDTKGSYSGLFQCDYFVSQSSFFDDSLCSIFGIKKEQILDLGFPRNDILFNQNLSINKLFSDISDYSKVIVWMPTFREHKNQKRKDSDSNFYYGIPIVNDEKQIIELNNCLKQENVLLVIKPHPVQDLSRILKISGLSNLRVMYGEDLQKKGIQLNEFLQQTDALITDYSGVYFDYLLLDKPIGITLDDYQNYKAGIGVVFENLFDVLKGRYIFNNSDLISFIKEVSNNFDSTLADRQKIKALTNVQPYDKSTQRVYEFVIEWMKQQKMLEQ